MVKATSEKGATLTQEKARWIYQKMVEIRRFEERVHDLFAQGQIPGFVHLYAGQEAIAAGVCAHLSEEDVITSTHRGHGHCIAKNCDLDGMMAEILGKATGLCKGKGGSMHIADVTKGMLGANGIVGGGFTLAAGAAMAAQYKNTDNVSVCFFGDGAQNQGSFHEAANMAGIWKLPVIFIAENNGFGEATPFEYASACERISDRAASYNMPGITVDGKDLMAVYEAAEEAVRRARNGEGPTLIECITYRNFGHFEGDNMRYMTPEETEKHKTELDNIKLFSDYLQEKNILTKEELDEIDQSVEKAVEKAVKFAKESPFPDASELLTDVYVSY